MSNCEVKISISDDDLKVYADFVPARGEGSELNMLYVKGIIGEEGIRNYVDWPLINSTIDFCNKNLKDRKGVLIAKGRKPISEIPPHWNLQEHLFKNAMGVSEESLEKIDYHERSPFVMVKKGELLAIWDKGREGIPGQGVKGKQIPFKKKNIIQFSAGKNTKEHEERLYAITSGRFEVSEEKEIIINDVLHIEGNVDYSTGNISFAKDVIIEGEIKDGFKVAAGGSIYCKSNVDATDILCRKDFIADKGIIGRGAAIIKVGGKISAKFIENCDIESQAGISVEKNILNSSVYSLGSLTLGEKGAIVSCHVYSEKDITVYNIGKTGSPNSEIYAGFSFIEKRSVDSIRQRVNVLKEKYEHLNKLPDFRKTEKKLKLMEQILSVINKSEETLKEKEDKLYSNLDASISVLGTIYPGNIISICGADLTIHKELKKIKFIYDKKQNRVEYVPL